MYVLWKIAEKFDNSLSLSHSPAITPSSLSSLSLSLPLLLFPLFLFRTHSLSSFFLHLPLLLVLSDSFSLFFLSPPYTHYLCLPPISFFTLSFDHPLSYSPSRCYSISLPSSLFLSLSSPRTPFLFALFVCYVRLCTAGNRLSVYSGSVSAVLCASPLRLPRISRKDDAFYSRGPSLRDVLRIHIVEIKFPPPPSVPAVLTLRDPCDTDSLGFFKGWLIFQASSLDRDVGNKHEHAASHPFNFRSFFSPCPCLFHFISLSLFPFS